MVGPLAEDPLHRLVLGQLPYKVTPLDGIKERLGAATSTARASTGSRSRTSDRQVPHRDRRGRRHQRGRRDGAAPSATEQFDVFDWGQGVVTLRSVANGKYVGEQLAALVNTRTSPTAGSSSSSSSWRRRPTARRHQVRRIRDRRDWFGPDNYVRAAADGTLGLPDGRRRRQLHQGGRSAAAIDEAVAAAKGADAAVVVVGSMPFINGREDHDRTTMGSAKARRRWSRPSRKANPNTVVVLENSYPTTSLAPGERTRDPVDHPRRRRDRARRRRRAVRRRQPGRPTHPDLVPPDADLPDILDYDIIKTGRTYLYWQGEPALRLRPRPELHPFGYGELRAVAR